MGAQQWPPAPLILPKEHPFRPALLRIPVLDPQGLHRQEFSPIHHCPAAWRFLSLLHPMALLPHTLRHPLGKPAGASLIAQPQHPWFFRMQAGRV